MTKYTLKTRKQAAQAWALELGGADALRRLLRLKAASLEAALLGRPLEEAEAAKIDAALAERERLGPAHYSRLLRALRTATNLRSQDVAVGAGISLTRMTEYESGRVVPDLSTALALWRFWSARFPAIHMEHLFGGGLPVDQLGALLVAKS